MYYVNEENIGSEIVKYLGNEASVHEILEVYHHVKVVNIKVARDVQPASTQANENYMNIQESCSVKNVVEESELQKQINDRKAQLERSMIQREVDLNHFEGDTEVSKFYSDDSDGSAAEAVQMEIDCPSEEDRPLESTALVKYVKNPGPTSRCHNEVEHKQRPVWFPEPDEFCFAGDLGISDEEEEDEVELPYLMKKSKINKKKMKDRFREALRDFHIRTLRRWDMTGVTCSHAIAAMSKVHMHPEDCVHEFFKKPLYIEAYKDIVYPVPGPEFWPDTQTQDIEPLVFKEKADKKQTARTKGQFEVPAPKDTREQRNLQCFL
ncbi:hypothetical protein D1007_51689 [Hordeum vulgare]|nr:hypothetical protein D1007_51689 [Hordeum vulgare]